MTTYIVTLDVNRLEFYAVEAASVEEAREHFHDGKGEFLDYEARTVEIDEIQEKEEN